MFDATLNFLPGKRCPAVPPTPYLMKNYFALFSTILLAVLVNTDQSNAQCSAIPCNTPQYSNNAPDACILPNPGALDCYYGATMPDFPQSFPPFWCNTIENNQWFAFTADAPTASFDISVYACSVGGGIQAAVLATDDCINFSFVSQCMGNVLEHSTQNLLATNLIPGKNYYLMIDGNAGAICGFGINNVQAQPPMAIKPTDGETGLGLNVLLQWSSVAIANYYFLEVATNPNFSAGSIILSQTVSATSFLLENLEPKTIYYWRLSSVGNCAAGGFSNTYAFQTGLIKCDQEFSSTEVPQSIDTQIDSIGTTGALSTVMVPQNKPILDINVSLAFDHPRTGDLSAYLVSPDNDSILLFDRPGVPSTQFGCAEGNGDLTFDDEATQSASDLEAQCAPLPPALNGLFQPMDNLSVLHNKNPMGQWRLGMLDHEQEEAGGTITSWSLSFCFLEKVASGQLLVNSPLVILTGQTDAITQNLLNMAVAQPPAQIVFTLLAIPLYGTLSLNGMLLEVGSTFTQDDINTGNLTYTHDDNAAMQDNFHFDAIDKSNCAWVHDAVFTIYIVYDYLEATADQTQGILCTNDATGEIIAYATGLNGVYTYSLNGGPSQSDNVFSGLSAGTYTVVVTGQFELMDTTTAIIILNPSLLDAVATVDCNAATLIISGGTPPYVSDPPQVDLNNLPNGVYQVWVTDNNGCNTSTAFSVNIPPLELSVDTDSVRCFDGNSGAITASGSGGCPPYTYSLAGSTFLSNNTFSDLSAGTYSLIIKDSKGNERFSLVTVFQPVLLGLTVAINGNTLIADASGGIPPYSYSFNGSQPQSSGVFAGLAPGTYTIVVTDSNGCVASETNLVVTSSTMEAKDVWGVVVSPNPGNGLFRLVVQKAPERLFTQVFDMTGRLLKSFDLQAANGKLETTLDLQAFPNGPYMLLLNDGKIQGSLLLNKADK